MFSLFDTSNNCNVTEPPFTNQTKVTDNTDDDDMSSEEERFIHSFHHQTAGTTGTMDVRSDNTAAKMVTTTTSTTRTMTLLDCPRTPDGLRPRKSIQSLCQQLGITEDWIQQQQPVVVHHHHPSTQSSIQEVLVSDNTIRDNQGCFPMNILPSVGSGEEKTHSNNTSWFLTHGKTLYNTSSQATTTTSTSRTDKSSLFNHNFASWSSSWDGGGDCYPTTTTTMGSQQPQQQQLPTATSPSLDPYESKTAVGAAVAAALDHQQQGSSTGTFQRMSTNHYHHDHHHHHHHAQNCLSWKDLSRDDINFITEKDYNTNNNNNNGHIVVKNDGKHQLDSFVLPYLPSTSTQQTGPFLPDIDENSMVAASPSSRAYGYGRQPLVQTQTKRTAPTTKDNFHHHEDPNISFNSTSRTERMKHHHHHATITKSTRIDSQSEHFGVFLVPDHSSSNVNKIDLTDSESDNDSMELHRRKQNRKNEFAHTTTNNNNVETGMDTNFLSIKVRNQRRAKEGLLYSTYERLHDNVTIIQDVERIERLTFDWVKMTTTTSHTNNIVTGFPNEIRTRIVRKLDLLINDILVHKEKHFFPKSSMEYNGVTTVVQSGSSSTQEIIDSLQFCKTLSLMAVCAEEEEEYVITTNTMIDTTDNNNIMGRWNLLPGLRSSLGIREDSPVTYNKKVQKTKAYGNGNLPPYSVGTPMTSNVSVATTLSSTIGGHFTSFENSDANSINDNHDRNFNGLLLRQVIVMITSILHDLTTCLLDLSDIPDDATSKKTNSITAAIKLHYSKLMKIRHSDLKSLILGFEFDYYNSSWMEIMEYEEDDDDDDDTPVQLILPDRTILSDEINDGLHSFDKGQESFLLPLPPPFPIRRRRNCVNRFAPIRIENSNHDSLPHIPDLLTDEHRDDKNNNNNNNKADHHNNNDNEYDCVKQKRHTHHHRSKNIIMSRRRIIRNHSISISSIDERDEWISNSKDDMEFYRFDVSK